MCNGAKKKNIPVGISDFQKIREREYYYIDKSGLIAELLNGEPAEVTLITRPRRFGKTLAMGMLADFFDIRKDSGKLFSGLKITNNIQICDEWMNKYPVLFISFKRVDGLNFNDAFYMLRSVIAEACAEHRYLLESNKPDLYDKSAIKNIIELKAGEAELKNSLISLTRAMYKYYGKTVILLIDEYDVPVAKAEENRYYAQMLDLMKGMMQALKDNQSLCFSVVTGCMRIAKESIFTGTNNFVSDTIMDSRLNEYFGFTQNEVYQLMLDTGTTARADDMKAWYDGYRFGNIDIYCPWDVMNFVRDLLHDPEAKPESYWKNSSDNAIVRSFIENSGSAVTNKLEELLAGGYVIQRIDKDLTYDYLHSSEDNLWSILYLTGYLTVADASSVVENVPDGCTALMIPNAEIRDIFETTVMKWFAESSVTWNRKALFESVWSGNCETLTNEMTKLLRRTISYHDYREDFYHAFLAGIFAGAGYRVESNKEHGEGRSDVVVYDEINARVAVFEAKYSKELNGLEAACDAAVDQINNRMYAEEFQDDYDTVFCYGIAFYRKRCMVKEK